MPPPGTRSRPPVEVDDTGILRDPFPETTVTRNGDESQFVLVKKPEMERLIRNQTSPGTLTHSGADGNAREMDWKTTLGEHAVPYED